LLYIFLSVAAIVVTAAFGQMDYMIC
jgi:hypothetical protein